jgi:hypothetical protein
MFLEERRPRVPYHLMEAHDRVGDAIYGAALANDIVVLFKEAGANQSVEWV